MSIGDNMFKKMRCDHDYYYVKEYLEYGNFKKYKMYTVYCPKCKKVTELMDSEYVNMIQIKKIDEFYNKGKFK